MKRLLLLSFIIAGSLIATTGNAQVYIHANVGFRAPRIFCAPPVPAVVYENSYTVPQPYYPRRGYEREVVTYGHGYERSRYNNAYFERRDIRNYRDCDDHRWKHHRHW